MLRTWIQKYGPVRVTLGVTVACVAGSLALTALVDLAMHSSTDASSLVPAIVIPSVLAPLIGFQFIRLLDHLDRAELDLRRLASVDSLTQVYNRGHILLLTEREILRARRYDRPLALLLLDVDYFKSVNDRYGHSVGDRVLRAVSDLLQQQLRRTDLLGRYGGEEFVIVLPETDAVGARTVAERIRVALQDQAIAVGTIETRVTASVGITALRPEMQDIDAFLAHADAALYRAKDKGRNRVEFA